MPENEESRAAERARAAARAVIDAQAEPEPSETPGERGARFLRHAPDGETPEQRTGRFMEKARRAGYTYRSPMSPNEVEAPEADLELDDKGQVVRPKLTWNNAAEELIGRAAHRAAQAIGTSPDPQKQRAENELQLMRARNEVDQRAIPAAEWAKGHVPGMRLANEALTYRDRVPEPRQPIQMQREFSNDQEKEAYLERIRQAQARAGSR